MATNLRPVVPDDREALVGVLRSDGTFTGDEIAVALELIDHAIRKTDDYLVRVAALDDSALPRGVGGYICYGPTPMTEATWDLYWIVVHAEARGRGLARALVAHMEDDVRARAGRAVRVETSELEAYGSARKLYDALGYPEASRLPDFYRAGDALITYYKRL